MNKISTLIGTILDEEPREHHTSPRGEKFLILRASLHKLIMDVVVSSCIYSGITGRVKILGTYCTEHIKTENGKVLHSFIYASNILPASSEEHETNEINVHAKITSNHKYIVSEGGIELLFFYASKRNIFGKTDVLKFCARGECARKLHNITPGEWINCTGYIKEYKDTTEIIVKDIIDEFDSVEDDFPGESIEDTTGTAIEEAAVL